MRISTKTFSVVASGLFAVGVAAGVIGGCSSSSNYVGICEQSCDKQVSCQGDAGGFNLTTSQCMTICQSMANTTSCPNAAAVASAAQACLSKSDCTQFEACAAAAPTCTSGGATGGTSGGGTSGTGTGGTTGSAGHAGSTGGTTGSAGSSGTAATCAACDKAMACCTASGQPATTCSAISAATCNQASGTTQANLIAECQAAVAAGAAQGIAGCM